MFDSDKPGFGLENCPTAAKVLADRAQKRAVRDTASDEIGMMDRPTAPFEAQERDMRGCEDEITPLDVISLSSLSGRPIQERDEIVMDLIPAGKVTILNGDGGVGKTLLLQQLCVAAVTGGYWCGRKVKQGHSLFITAEDDDDELHRRFDAVARGMGVSLSDLADLEFRSLDGEDPLLAIAKSKSGKLEPTTLFKRLERLVAERQPMLLALDPLADLFGGEEINRSHAVQFIGMFRRLCRQYGTTVILAAHPSRSGIASGEGSSGSTGWSNSSRSRLYFTWDQDDDDARILRNMKANYGKRGTEVRLRWVEGMFKLENGPDSLVAMAAQNQTDRLFLDLLAKFTAEGRIVSDNTGRNYAPSIFAKDPRAGGTTNKGFEAAMLRLFAAKKIRVETVGPPTRSKSKLVAVE